MQVSKRTIFCAFWLLVACMDLAGQPENSVSGQVVDSWSGRPLYGALVFVAMADSAGISDDQTQTITDVDGRFVLMIDARARYTIGVRHLGYRPLLHALQQNARHVELSLTEAPLTLDEIIVYSLPATQSAGETALPITIKNNNEWDSYMPADLPEVLGSMSGVALSGDGIWARSVQIRGLGADRYVSMVDGNRIETAHDLSGSLAMIDMADVERVEVVKGALSSLYGSGAMGGIVNVITRSGEYSNDYYLRGRTTMEYHSTNHLASPSLSLTGGHRNWHAHLHLGYRKARDARSPEGPIMNSRFSDWNLSANMAFKPAENQELVLRYQQFRATAGIPGGSVLPAPAEATYRDADRTLFSAEYTMKNPIPAVRNLKARLFRQSVYRNVDISPNVPPKGDALSRVRPLLLQPSATHITHGGSLESVWHTSTRHKLVTGLEAWQRRLESRRTRTLLREQLDGEGKVINSTEIIRGEIPIPPSQFHSAGVFVQYEWYPHSRWKLAAGGRLDRIGFSNEETHDPDYLIRFGERIDNPPGQVVVYPAKTSYGTTWALNGSVLYRPTDMVWITASAGSAYRAPALEERYKFIDLGHVVELGNPDLKPERGNFFDLGSRLETERLQIMANVFVHQLDNLITMAPADSVAFIQTADGTVPVKRFARRYKNIARATLAGFDAEARWMAYPGNTIYGNISYVHGVDRDSGQPLPAIAPLNLVIGIRQKLGKAGAIDVRVRGYHRQDRVAEGEKPTPGYALLDGYIHSAPINIGTAQLHWTAGVENALNAAYRNHLATNRGNWSLEPGRNFKCRLTILW